VQVSSRIAQAIKKRRRSDVTKSPGKSGKGDDDDDDLSVFSATTADRTTPPK
jgi:hypothetical protein